MNGAPPPAAPGNPFPKVALVVVAYNDATMLRRCLDSALANGHPAVEAIVVDNSTTGEVENAMRAYPSARYLRMPENLGFCGANNAGIRAAGEAGADYALLLNHDAVLEPGCLAALLARAAAGPKAGIITGKILFPSSERRIWYAGGYFSRLIGAGKNLGFGEVDDGRYDVPREVDYATGCCMLVPMGVFAAAGALDEAFFMYLDDIEFCLRVRRAGYRIYYEPKAVVRHDLGSGDVLRRRPDYYLYFSVRNKPMVVRRGLYGLYLRFAMLAVAAVKLLQFLVAPGIPERPAKLRAIVWGAVDGLTGAQAHRRRFPRLFARP